LPKGKKPKNDLKGGGSKGREKDDLKGAEGEAFRGSRGAVF